MHSRIERSGAKTQLSDDQTRKLLEIIDRKGSAQIISPWASSARAHNISRWQRQRAPSGRLRLWSLPVSMLLAAGVTAAAMYFTTGGSSSTLPRVNAIGLSGDCRIKGNISARGERIYHVPGQRYYLATRINPQRGERWFCSEWQAWLAGWRKAKL